MRVLSDRNENFELSCFSYLLKIPVPVILSHLQLNQPDRGLTCTQSNNWHKIKPPNDLSQLLKMLKMYSSKDLGRLYRFSAQSLIVSGSFCVNFIEKNVAFSVKLKV